METNLEKIKHEIATRKKAMAFLDKAIKTQQSTLTKSGILLDNLYIELAVEETLQQSYPAWVIDNSTRWAVNGVGEVLTQSDVDMKIRFHTMGNLFYIEKDAIYFRDNKRARIRLERAVPK